MTVQQYSATTKMQVTSRNTNTLQPVIYDLLQEKGIRESSRNGPVLRIPEPVLIRLTHPFERVNFCPIRDANPFFHLLEAMAILAGVNSIQFMAHFAQNMLSYSDDGITQNAFYGTRLRYTWGNQLDQVIKNLVESPNSRREIALIWDPADLTKETKDKACNVVLMFSINANNSVEMTSINRSNDAIWGFVNGANIVHLSIIHEYVAMSLGRTMGDWWHFSNNLHVYIENPKWDLMCALARAHDPYSSITQEATFMRLIPLFVDPDQKTVFDRQLNDIMALMVGGKVWSNGQLLTMPGTGLPFLLDVIGMFNAWQMHKFKRQPLNDIIRHLNLHIHASDWRRAGIAWMQRRYSGKAVTA